MTTEYRDIKDESVRALPAKPREITFPLCIFLCLLILFLRPGPVFSEEQSSKELKKYLSALRIQNERYGWKDIKLDGIVWESHRTTKNNHPLIFTQFGDSSRDCILFLGGVHGDELPTVYLMLKLAQYLKEHPEVARDRCIVIVPLVNPDGFLSANPTRVNANGIDVNRNFPTRNWKPDARLQWVEKGKSNPRYYPGAHAGSEQETLFQVALIKRFNPQKILSVHSPLNFFDYDGPSSDLDSFEKWMERISKESNHPLKKFGCFPGSLGNYAGIERNIFTLTLELSTSDPHKGSEYFSRFQPAFLKFINLPVVGAPPYTRLVKSDKR